MYKVLKHIFALLCIACAAQAMAQGGMAQAMVNCIEAQDINRLSQNFAPQVEVSIQGNGGVYNQTQAKMAIDAFVAEKGVKNCSVTHNGDRENSGFCILSLSTRDGGTYRIYSFYKQDEGKMLIQQFRIDND